MPTRPLLLVACLALGLGLPSCNASAGTVGGAALMTGLAAGVSASRRADGDCYTPCTQGTQCNRNNGLCERQPCRGECLPSEKCEESWTGSVRCIGSNGLAVSRGAPRPAPVAPAAASAPAPSAAATPAGANVPAGASGAAPAAALSSGQAAPPEKPQMPAQTPASFAPPRVPSSSAPADVHLPADGDSFSPR